MGPEPLHDEPVKARENAPARAPVAAPLRPDAARVLALQRTVGNRATANLLMRDYEGERGDSPLPSAPDELTFDGEYLKMHGPGVSYSWRAYSGKPDSWGGFDYSVERQKKRDEGPIPEGEYWLDPRQLVNLEERWLYGWRYETPWGTHRITIHPFTKTETYGRGGFFIHGGTVAGSAGCIDLTTNMKAFARKLAAWAVSPRYCAEQRKILLHVKYAWAYKSAMNETAEPQEAAYA